MKNLILLISACVLVAITGCRQDCPGGVCPREMTDIVQASHEVEECCDAKCKRNECKDVTGCPFLSAHPNAMKCPFFKNLMAEKCCDCCKCENCKCDPCDCCKCENCKCDPCDCCKCENCKCKDCCKPQKPECKNCEEPCDKKCEKSCNKEKTCKTKFYHWNTLLLRKHRHPCH